MRKKNIKKIVYLLEEHGTLSVDLAIDKLNIPRIEAESIFKFLIINEYVLNVSSKTDMEISADKYVDYKWLSRNLPIKSKSRKIFNLAWKVLVVIGFILGVITDGFGLLDRSHKNESKKANTISQDQFEKKNGNAYQTDTTKMINDTLLKE